MDFFAKIRRQLVKTPHPSGEFDQQYNVCMCKSPTGVGLTVVCQYEVSADRLKLM